jgi:hypothetical protein
MKFDYRARITNDGVDTLLNVRIDRGPTSELDDVDTTIAPSDTYLAKWNKGDTLAINGVTVDAE